MNLVDQCRERKIHTRNIEISTYEYDEEHIVIDPKIRLSAFPPDTRPSKDGLNDAAHTRQGPVHIAEKVKPAK